tara:strand:+ start:438 stop:914 length:477 start_codon:yes stop_codon:yes gene_type:complete
MIKKTKKKNYKMKINLLVENLHFNNCSILLGKAESFYLTEEIVKLHNSNLLTIESVKDLLVNFKENSNIRYYTNKNINQIALNLLNIFQKKTIKEELGRNFSTDKGVYSSVNDSGSISPEGVLFYIDDHYDSIDLDEDEEQKFIHNRNILTKKIVKNR